MPQDVMPRLMRQTSGMDSLLYQMRDCPTELFSNVRFHLQSAHNMLQDVILRLMSNFWHGFCFLALPNADSVPLSYFKCEISTSVPYKKVA
jgi:hypothetical protein